MSDHIATDMIERPIRIQRKRTNAPSPPHQKEGETP
jgi:hypothetical protein